MLLLVAYTSFGWFLTQPTYRTWQGCSIPYMLAFGGIWLLSAVFMSPLTSFTRLIQRWFKSDTVAFLSIFMFAAAAAVVLYWLQVFLYILTILATEALARIDIQAMGYGNRQAFWILTIVSILGLLLGWAIRASIPLSLSEGLALMQMRMEWVMQTFR